MTQVLPVNDGDEETPRQSLMRWAAATLCIASLHAGTVFAFVNWPRSPLPAGEPPAAVMIELAPAPVAPDVEQQDVAVGPQQDMSEESSPTEIEEKPIEEVEPDKPTEAKADPAPEPLPEPPEPKVEAESDVPKLPQIETAEAVLPTAEPPPPEKKEEEKKEEEKKPEQKPSKPKPKSTPKTAAAPKPVDAARAKVNAAPSSGTATAASIASWRGTVVAHLNRHKRYPGGGAGGTSSVVFTIDRSGRVLSARLIRSSGNKTLDQEAVGLARRASPVPRPPANIPGGSIMLAVPIRFSR